MDLMKRLFKSLSFTDLKLIILGGIPLVLVCLPFDYFDTGQSISMFAWLGVQDYIHSTGMTRAVMHLIHFDFPGAWGYNRLSFIVLPLLIYVWADYFIKSLRTKKLEIQKTIQNEN